jgi:tight adherence protein C
LTATSDNYYIEKSIKILATTFKVQAEDMRQFREEQVKELAEKASPKVTLATTFVVAPVSILMIAGLMLLNLIYGENSIIKLFDNKV